MPPVTGRFTNEAQVHKSFEHVRVLQLPKDTIIAMGDLAAAHADVGLVEMPFVRVDKKFDAGIWNNGNITGSRPDGERLEKGNTAAAIVSNMDASKFYRGVFELISGAPVTQKSYSSRPPMQGTQGQRTSSTPKKATKVGWR